MSASEISTHSKWPLVIPNGPGAGIMMSCPMERPPVGRPSKLPRGLWKILSSPSVKLRRASFERRLLSTSPEGL